MLLIFRIFCDASAISRATTDRSKEDLDPEIYVWKCFAPPKTFHQPASYWQ
jgi:hypothetical protein